MSKRFKDDGSEHSGPHRVITLTPDNAVHSGSGAHPTPLTVEETREVLGEMDRLTTQVQGLTSKIAELRNQLRESQEQLEAKNKTIAELQSQASQIGSPENYSRAPDQETGDAADLKAQLEAKDKEIAELKDKYLRALADSENAKRRIRQQSDDSVRLQRENLLRDLLPIVDNLERAVAAARTGSGDGKTILQGVEMVLASMMDFLKANGVTPQSSVGQQFDPAKHEAADRVASDKHAPNSVVEEFHRGYAMGDKVLRPARVVVAKGTNNKQA
jgi:molecular chaperone GrpE